MKKLSVVITSYNNQKHLKKNIDSIYQKFAGFSDWEIIIINNDSRQDIRKFPLDFSKVKIVDHRENVGFGSGINLGAKEAMGEFLLILNPDTEIISGNAFDVLNEFSKDESIGIIGGGIVNEGEKRQPWSAGKEVSIY
ncbi:MAG: glycosyltransferase, partial [Candidatus Moranbacteria bacterium]|nr:glycosyltransferase [Candidatus Moranbacteria bacterium]